MPCNSDHCEPSWAEREAEKVIQLSDELDGKPLDPESFGCGYDRRAYGRDAAQLLRNLVPRLCERLSKVDVTKYSLEMQIWWRDHQKADAKRLAKEEQERQQQAAYDAAMAKLTPEEQSIIRGKCGQ